MPPFSLHKVSSTGSLSSVTSMASSSPESSVSSHRKKLKSPRGLPPLGVPPSRRRLSWADGGGGPPTLQRSRSISTDVVSSTTARTPPSRVRNRRRTKSFESPSLVSKSSPNTMAAPQERSDLDWKLQRAILQYGSSHPRVGELWNAMGNAYFRSGDFRGAIRAYKNATQCGSGNHVATAYLNLGTAYWNTLQVRKSIEYLQRALEAFQTDLASESKSPRDSLDVASCYHQLGLAHALQESYDKACAAVEQALEIRARLLGPHSPLTARTLDAAGRIHTLRGDYPRALAYHEQALAVVSQAGLSPVITLEHMAAVYTAQGDWTGVVHMYVQVVYYLKSNWIVQPAPARLKKGLEQLAQAYEQVGEMRYADDCRQEAELLG